MNKTTSKIYPWVVVALLWGVALLNYMDRQMLSTMKESMQLDISELQTAENFGRLMAVFLWIYGLMSPFAGAIADRVNRKWLIVISLFVWSAVTYGMGYANTFTEIYWLRALMGVSEALYIPAGLSLIADWHSDKTRSLAVGIHMTGLYTGQAIGGFGATVAASYTWHTAFHWFGLIGIAYALLLVLCLRENPNHNVVKPNVETNKVEKESILKGFSALFSTVAFWIILFYFAAPSLPGWAIKNWLPTLFSENLNLPMAEAGPMSTITIALSSFCGVVAGGILSDRWVQRRDGERSYGSYAPPRYGQTPSHSRRGVLDRGRNDEYQSDPTKRGRASLRARTLSLSRSALEYAIHLPEGSLQSGPRERDGRADRHRSCTCPCGKFPGRKRSL